MTTTWTIKKLICKSALNNLSNVVYQIHWEFTKVLEEDNNTYTVKNNGIITLAEPDSNTFTEYDGLTKSQVISWVQTKLGQEYISEMDTRLTNLLISESNQVILPIPFEN
jgi:hypothetical protein